MGQTLAEEGNTDEARSHYKSAAESPDRKLRQAALEALNAFYEKVVKVKADVAAVLHFFLPLDPANRG